MLEIFSFYIGIVVQLFERVLQSFEVSEGIGYGTFLLCCGLFVVFINLLKFQLGSNGIEEIRNYRSKKQLLDANYKHSPGFGRVNSYFPKHSKKSGRYK